MVHLKTLLDFEIQNEAQSNDRIQIALQDLYEEMLKLDVIDPIEIMEDHNPPGTIGEKRDLTVRKIGGLHTAIIDA